MHDAVLYRLARDRAAQLRREAQEHRRRFEPRANDHMKSWSSLAYWQARRPQRAY